MHTNSQGMLSGIEKFHVPIHKDDKRRAQPVGVIPCSVSPLAQQLFEAMMDLESTRLMEERYGIREEGLF